MKLFINILFYLNILFSGVTLTSENLTGSCTKVQEFYKFTNESITKVESFDVLLSSTGLSNQFDKLEFNGYELEIPKLLESVKREVAGMTTIYTPDEKIIMVISTTNLDSIDYFSDRLMLKNLESVMASVFNSFDCKTKSATEVNSYIRDMILFNSMLSSGLRKKDFTYYAGKFEVGFLQINENYSKVFKRVLVEHNTIINVVITIVKS